MTLKFCLIVVVLNLFVLIQVGLTGIMPFSLYLKIIIVVNPVKPDICPKGE